MVAQTVGGFAAFAIIPKSLKTLMSLMVIMIAFTAYVVLLAAQSPSPWFKDSIIGSILAVSIRVSQNQELFEWTVAAVGVRSSLGCVRNWLARHSYVYAISADYGYPRR